ncbi:hypothetical protein AVEN_234868-1 [Araneus ventricosus]|uniref:ACAD9/ACADV-like C-terminal domain-containing protein n=1 Tax=Araneus ventricosus TaxID=182803 RepID=A0A4Y2IGD3_ARAVE|nr:hypothetical protein AVEN_234868-1 [Araneus ventricosus]
MRKQLVLLQIEENGEGAPCNFNASVWNRSSGKKLVYEWFKRFRDRQKTVDDEQFLLNRLANAAIDIYAMASILSRATFSLNKNVPSADYEEKLVNVYCDEAYERVFQHLGVLKSRSKLKNFEFMRAVSLDVANTGGPLQLNPLGV